MQVNKNSLNPLVVGAISILCAYLVIYALSVILSFGTLIISGLYLSIITLLNGVWGFIAFIIIKMVNVKWHKGIDIIFIIIINLVVVSIYDEKTKITPGIEHIGGSIIVRHNVAEGSVLSVGGILFVTLISLLLLMLYYFFEKKIYINK